MFSDDEEEVKSGNDEEEACETPEGEAEEAEVEEEEVEMHFKLDAPSSKCKKHRLSDDLCHRHESSC